MAPFDSATVERVARALCKSVDAFADPDAPTLCQETLLVRGEGAKEWERFIPGARAALEAITPEQDMGADELVVHARKLRADLNDELPNGVGNTIDALLARIFSLKEAYRIICDMNKGADDRIASLIAERDEMREALKVSKAYSEMLAQELTNLRGGMEQSVWHDVNGERMKRILVAETAIKRIDAALQGC